MAVALRIVTPRPAAPEALPVTDLPEPLTPLEIDLRAFKDMQLDVARLRDSDLASIADAEVFRVAVLSWCVSWHQIPAASLPDDDMSLCRLLGFGRDMRGWKRVRTAGGLRGWVKCSDGRLYHPVVAEKAIEAWGWKQGAKRKRERDAERLRRWREARDGTHHETPDETRFNAERTERSRTERSGAERNGSKNTTPPPSSGVSSPKPAATAAALTRRVDGVDAKRVRQALEHGDLLELVGAFGANVEDDRAGEWQRDTDGLQLGVVATIFAWRRVEREPIREPSGFRPWREQWRGMPATARKALTEILEDYGVHLPQTTP